MSFTFTSASLCEKCPYSELFWSAFPPYFPGFRHKTERYGVCIWACEYVSGHVNRKYVSEHVNALI